MENKHDSHEHALQLNLRDKVMQTFPKHAYNMINVGRKIATSRCALAQGKIYVGEEAFRQIQDKTMPKGDPLTLAEVAGINGAKCAYQVIPLCHPLSLEQAVVYTVPDASDYSITVYCMAAAFAKTGVEMEALAGVNSALLAIYDLCKIVNADLAISDIRLLYKEGGKSGVWTHSQGIPDELRKILNNPQLPLANIRAQVFEMSDRAFKKQENYPDIGVFLKEELEKSGASPVNYELLPDNKEMIKKKIQQAVNESCDLIMLHGGTGITANDVTATAVNEMADRILPGIGELLRKNGESYTPYSWLSCSTAAVINKTLLIAIPGSKNAIYEAMTILPELIAKAVRELHRV
ncbi:MAG TPA: cyclic pyranopterin monophosphate synthase MoaC [Legionella sp.]|nr:cyclic pyranopterin monophosphate synthase MoaC [Legionella sp.]